MKTTKLLLTLLSATAFAVAARATLVTLNTSSLAGGTYYVDFQLNDGHSTGNGNNTAAVTQINLGGGTAGGDLASWGLVTGDLSSSVWLTDTDPFTEFYQSFTAGSFLSFDLWLSNHADSPSPDTFAFSILDENLNNLFTYSPDGGQFLIVELTGGALNYQAYAEVGGIAAPQVPEMGSTALFAALALAGLAGARRQLARVRIAA